MIIERDIVYAERQSSRLALDLYLPQGHIKALVAYAHGGGFTRGSRTSEMVTRLAKRLTGDGYVLASVDYRLNVGIQTFKNEQQNCIKANLSRSQRAGLTLAKRLMGARCEAARRDIGDALDYLRNNRSRWGIHNTRIGLIGTSAGGMAGMALAYPPRNLPTCASPDAVFVLGGALIHPWRLHPKGPRSVFLHSDTDRIIPPQNLHLIKKRAEQSGAPIQVLTCARKGHNAPNQALFEDKDDAGTAYWRHMISLFDRELSPSPASA